MHMLQSSFPVVGQSLRGALPSWSNQPRMGTGAIMRRSARSSHRPALGLQTLESRDVPAGNVFANLTNGLLTLVGDDLANAVTIRVVGTSVTVTGNAGTLVGGLPTIGGIGVVNAVQANLNGGDDSLRIDSTANFLIPGAI